MGVTADVYIDILGQWKCSKFIVVMVAQFGEHKKQQLNCILFIGECIVCELHVIKLLKISLVKWCQHKHNRKGAPNYRTIWVSKRLGCIQPQHILVYNTSECVITTEKVSHHPPLEVARAPIISLKNWKRKRTELILLCLHELYIHVIE